MSTTNYIYCVEFRLEVKRTVNVEIKWQFLRDNPYPYELYGIIASKSNTWHLLARYEYEYLGIKRMYLRDCR